MEPYNKVGFKVIYKKFTEAIIRFANTEEGKADIVADMIKSAEYCRYVYQEDREPIMEVYWEREYWNQYNEQTAIFKYFLWYLKSIGMKKDFHFIQLILTDDEICEAGELEDKITVSRELIF